jgi:hypothetical protein
MRTSPLAELEIAIQPIAVLKVAYINSLVTAS